MARKVFTCSDPGKTVKARDGETAETARVFGRRRAASRRRWRATLLQGGQGHGRSGFEELRARAWASAEASVRESEDVQSDYE